MNNVIIKADLSTVKEYTGKSVVAKIGKKKYEVAFRVNIDDFTFDEGVLLARTDANILMLNYVGSQEGLKEVANGVYIVRSVDVGNDLTEVDIMTLRQDTPDGVTLVLKIPSDYNNIRFLYDMSIKYPDIRFCGGCLFCFDDCKFGCCGRDICSSNGIKFDEDDYLKEGCSCAIPAYDICDVELSATDGKQKTATKKKSGTSSRKTAMFSSLLYSGGKVDL